MRALKMLLLPLLHLLLLLLLRAASGTGEQSWCGRLNLPLEPTQRVDSEAGTTELYDERCGQLSCARIRIQRNGLLPSYSNSPCLVHTVQGRGIVGVGVAIPGYPETYQQTTMKVQEQEEEDDRRGFEQYSNVDEHQRITSIRPGDVEIIPAGSSFWVHNDGDQTLVALVVHDVSNSANQSEPEQECGINESYNIVSGFDAESINVSGETINDQRGNIVAIFSPA